MKKPPAKPAAFLQLRGVTGCYKSSPAFLTEREISQLALKSERQAAEFLGVSVKTLRNQRWRGVGPAFVKFPTGGVRYDDAVLIAYVEANTFTSTTAAQAAHTAPG